MENILINKIAKIIIVFFINNFTLSKQKQKIFIYISISLKTFVR